MKYLKYFENHNVSGLSIGDYVQVEDGSVNVQKYITRHNNNIGKIYDIGISKVYIEFEYVGNIYWGSTFYYRIVHSAKSIKELKIKIDADKFNL